MLTNKQQDLIRELAIDYHITEPADIISWCISEIMQPDRKEPKQFYRDIVEALK